MRVADDVLDLIEATPLVGSFAPVAEGVPLNVGTVTTESAELEERLPP